MTLQAVSAQSTPQLTWGPGGAGGSGTWSTDSTNVDWFNGTANVPWTDGDAALFSGTAGTVSILGSVTTPKVTFSTPGYTIQNFFLSGAASGLTVQTDADATISSSIFGDLPATTPFIKTGSGVLTFTGQGPVFFGSATIATGEIRFTGTGSPNFTTPYILANVPGAALTFASVNNTVAYPGGGGTNSSVRPNVTSGNLNLAIYGSADASFGGTIRDNGGATLAFQKNGNSTQALTGVNTYSGATTVSTGTLALAGANGSLTNTASMTINTGGTLLLDNAGAASDDRVANGLPVNLRGGTFSLTGNATTSSKALVGAVNFSSASNVSVTQPGAAAATLTFSSLTRQNNGTVNLSGGGNITLRGVTNLNGIVGGYATVGTDWATVDANNRVFAYTGYVTDLGSPTDQNNVRLTSAGGATTTVSGSQIHNSLNLVNTGSSAAVLDLGAGQRFDISSGGLLTSGGAGHVVQNGTLTSSGGELIVTNLSALTVSSTVADNGRALTLTKSGAGTLTLTGANAYTGATVIDQGVVRVGADNNLGAGNAVAFDGGALQATASFASAKSLQGGVGTVDTAGFNVAFNGGNNTGTVIKTGAGSLSLTGAVSAVNVTAGTLRLTNLTSSNSSVFLSAGRLEATGNVRTLQSTFGPAEISPGAIGEAASLTVGTFLVLGSGTVVDFDLGSTTQDSLTATSSFSVNSSPLLFRFGNLGGLRTGTAYALLNVPNFGNISATNFGIDPASIAAGYQGTFGVTGNVVSIIFSAIPEPGTWVWLGVMLGVLGLRSGGKRGMLPGHVTPVTNDQKPKPA